MPASRTTETKKKTSVRKKSTIKSTIKKKKSVAKKASKAKSVVKRKTLTTKKKKPVISREERSAMIAVHAYFKAESIGFPGGSDKEHWLEAEREIDAILKGK